jgi:tetratricopeptide (TPR) repeat protein
MDASTMKETAMNRQQSRRTPRAPAVIAGALLLALAGCEWADPTRVQNPQTTPEDIAAARNPTAAMLPGLRAQFARAVRATVMITEIVSDNYSNQRTGLSTELNDPYDMIPDVGSYNTIGATGLYWNLQELRALSDFTIDTIAPGDATATDEGLAEAHYYRGMAYLMQGENVAAAPAARDEEPLPHTDLLRRAVADLEASLGRSPGGEFAIRARAALARAHRALGESGQAASYANEVLGADPTFVFSQPYSTGELENTPWIYLVSRALKEMQPLPRLDFLDPKYHSRESPIPVAKAEEMNLILAEVALAGGSWQEARGHIADAVALAHTRPTATFDDDDARVNRDLSIRPRDDDMLVRADADSPFRAGLIQSRPGPVTVYTISGTSLNADSVRTQLTTEMEVRHAFWLARQEILFLEGRRMHDLGIRLPMTRREIDAGPHISRDHPAAQPFVPDYVPTAGRMNNFSPDSPYTRRELGEDPFTFEITIEVDMNRRLAEHFDRASPLLRN